MPAGLARFQCRSSSRRDLAIWLPLTGRCDPTSDFRPLDQITLGLQRRVSSPAFGPSGSAYLLSRARYIRHIEVQEHAETQIHKSLLQVQKRPIAARRCAIRFFRCRRRALMVTQQGGTCGLDGHLKKKSLLVVISIFGCPRCCTFIHENGMLGLRRSLSSKSRSRPPT